MICQNTVSENQSARYPWKNTSGPTQRRRGPENISSEKPNAHPRSSLQPYHQLPHPSYQSIALEKNAVRGTKDKDRAATKRNSKRRRDDSSEEGGWWKELWWRSRERHSRRCTHGSKVVAPPRWLQVASARLRTRLGQCGSRARARSHTRPLRGLRLSLSSVHPIFLQEEGPVLVRGHHNHVARGQHGRRSVAAAAAAPRSSWLRAFFPCFRLFCPFINFSSRFSSFSAPLLPRFDACVSTLFLSVSLLSFLSSPSAPLSSSYFSLFFHSCYLAIPLTGSFLLTAFLRHSY